MNRSPMPRTTGKPRACTAPGCVRTFIPLLPMQAVCGPVCARRKVNAARVADKAETKRRKEAIKTIPQLKREAQIEFNNFIRARDRAANAPCISSGRPLDWSGNGVDAGHYRSVGSAPHLRYDERNCHAQSKHDNQYKSGNAVDYRIGLIKRIGLEAVESLESDNRVHKWRREELIAIKEKYRQKLKDLRASACE